MKCYKSTRILLLCPLSILLFSLTGCFGPQEPANEYLVNHIKSEFIEKLPSYCELINIIPLYMSTSEVGGSVTFDADVKINEALLEQISFSNLLKQEGVELADLASAMNTFQALSEEYRGGIIKPELNTNNIPNVYSINQKEGDSFKVKGSFKATYNKATKAWTYTDFSSGAESSLKNNFEGTPRSRIPSDAIVLQEGGKKQIADWATHSLEFIRKVDKQNNIYKEEKKRREEEEQARLAKEAEAAQIKQQQEQREAQRIELKNYYSKFDPNLIYKGMVYYNAGGTRRLNMPTMCKFIFIDSNTKRCKLEIRSLEHPDLTVVYDGTLPFKNGMPDKDEYMRFKLNRPLPRNFVITTVGKNDDSTRYAHEHFWEEGEIRIQFDPNGNIIGAGNYLLDYHSFKFSPFNGTEADLFPGLYKQSSFISTQPTSQQATRTTHQITTSPKVTATQPDSSLLQVKSPNQLAESETTTLTSPPSPQPNWFDPDIFINACIVENSEGEHALDRQKFMDSYFGNDYRYMGEVTRINEKENLIVFRGGGSWPKNYDVQAKIHPEHISHFRSLKKGTQIQIQATLSEVITPKILNFGSNSIRFSNAVILKQ